MKGCLGLWQKIIDVDHTLLICCVYKEKIVKTTHTKQIIQILQPIIIDHFSTHFYIVDTLRYFLFVSYTIHLQCLYHVDSFRT